MLTAEGSRSVDDRDLIRVYRDTALHAQVGAKLSLVNVVLCKKRSSKMRTMAVSFILVAVGLVLLPAPTLAVTCPPGQLMICGGTGRPLPRGGIDWHCSCVDSSDTGKTTGGGKAEIHKKNVPTVRPNQTPGSNN